MVIERVRELSTETAKLVHDLANLLTVLGSTISESINSGIDGWKNEQKREMLSAYTRVVEMISSLRHNLRELRGVIDDSESST